MNKKIWIIIAVAVAVIVGIIAYFVVSDINQEEKLRNEISEIDGMINFENMNINEVNNRLSKTITTGDYAVVEKAYKQYLKDVLDNELKIEKILNDEKIEESLSAENYKQDGPEFKETKKYLSETIQSLKEYKEEYYNLLTEEKAMSYISNKDLDNYYKDFYKQEFLQGLSEEKNDKTIEDSINDIIALLQNSEEVIELLRNNPTAWKVEDENIEFNSADLTNKYNELLDKIM